VKTTVPIERQSDAELEKQVHELRRSRSPAAAQQEREIRMEQERRRMDRVRRERRAEETRRPPEPPAPVQETPDPASPAARRRTLEEARARLALEHDRTGDAGLLKQLRGVEYRLAEHSLAVERQELARGEVERQAREEEDRRATEEAERRKAQAERLLRKRQRNAAKMERAVDDLVVLLREDARLRNRLAEVTGQVIHKDAVVSWLQWQLHDEFPWDFPRVHEQFRGSLTELVT
jgi:hypothetical protein